MYKIEKLGTLFLMAIFAAFFVMTGGVSEKCQTYPYFVCSLGFLLCALNLGRAVYKEKKGIPIDTSAPLTTEQFISIIITLAVSSLYIFLASRVGYFIMTFLYVAGFSYYQSREQKKYLYPAVALGMCVVIYFAFKMFLHIPLPAGLLF